MKLYLTGRKVVKVNSIAEASQAFRKFIELNNFGASDLSAKSGEVMDGNKQIAKISYNGRAWQPGVWPTAEIKF